MYSLLVNFRCRGLKLVPIYSPKRTHSIIRNSSSYGGSGGGGGRGLLYTIGGLTLASGGTLAYAKYDSSFNKWLRDNVPYSDVVLDNVLKENYSEIVLDKIKDVTQVVKEKTADITQSLGVGEKDKKPEEQSLLKKKLDREASKKAKDEVTPPPPKAKEVIQEPVRAPEKIPAASVLEAPSKVEGTILPKPSKESVSVKHEPVITEKKTTTVLPENLAQMQAEISKASAEAVAAYAEATKIIANHTQKVFCAIENSIDKWDEDIWKSLRQKIEERDAAIKKAEEKSDHARDKIEALRDSLVGVTGNTAQSSRADAVKNLSSIDKASLDFKNEMARASLTEQYRDKVEAARKHFETEFSTLLPSLKVGEKNKHVTADEFDLFTYHLCRKLHFYQKELAKLETLGREALVKALAQRGMDVDSDLIKANLREELEQQRRKLEMEYQNAETQLRDTLCKQCKEEMRKASETHAKHLADAVTARTLELERRFKRELDEQITSEKLEFKSKLSSFLGRLKGIDAAMRARIEDDENAHKAQLMWTACQALLRAIKASAPSSLPWEDRLKPLRAEVEALQASAPINDELVTTVMAGIPHVAITRGVFPEDALRERFLKVDKVARSVALVGDHGAPLPVFLFSYLQSILLCRGAGGSAGGGSAMYGIPEEELADNPIDVRKLDTYDLLDRARYWLDRGDLGQALRYVNLLKGAPRVVAQDWIIETRVLLETKQVADILSAHAFASSGHHICPVKEEKGQQDSKGK